MLAVGSSRAPSRSAARDRPMIANPQRPELAQHCWAIAGFVFADWIWVFSRAR